MFDQCSMLSDQCLAIRDNKYRQHDKATKKQQECRIQFQITDREFKRPHDDNDTRDDSIKVTCSRLFLREVRLDLSRIVDRMNGRWKLQMNC